MAHTRPDLIAQDFVLTDIPQFDTTGRQSLTLGIRPEHLTILDHKKISDDPWVLDSKVVLAELLGADALLSLSVQGEPLTARVDGASYPEQGEQLCIRLNPEKLHAFDKVSQKSLPRLPVP